MTDKPDIVDRLESFMRPIHSAGEIDYALIEAIREITRLRAEKRRAYAHLRDAVAAERKACEEIADKVAEDMDATNYPAALIAETIRNRWSEER